MGEKDFSDRALVGDDSLSFVSRDVFRAVRSGVTDPIARAGLVADLCRINTLFMIMQAGSGHIGSSFSSTDIITWLWTEALHDPNGESEDADVYFSSKGHDAPALYSLLIAIEKLGFDLLPKLRQLHGLPGHPDVTTPFIATNTGSLGMGISKAYGMARANRYTGRSGRIVVMTGDGELQEGQIWESLQPVANERLADITVIVDHNKFQSDTAVAAVSDLGPLEEKFRAFGWEVRRGDGHDFARPARHACAFRDRDRQAEGVHRRHHQGQGRVVHGRHCLRRPDLSLPCRRAVARKLREGALASSSRASTRRLEALGQPLAVLTAAPLPVRISPKQPEKIVLAYGDELLEMARHRPEIIVMDADLLSDCGIEAFKAELPERFIECGIAEMHMVSAAGGMALRGMLPVVHSFACFLSTRANEHIYNNATEKRRIIYTATLAGLVPGGPGHSHQSVRDISAIGAVPGLVAFEPCSEKEARLAIRWAVEQNPDSTYLRFVNVPLDLPYSMPADYTLQVGRGVTLRSGADVAIIGYGTILLTNAWRAADELAKQGISAAVIDLPWLNRIDDEWVKTLGAFGHIVTLDNHYLEYGQGVMIGAALARTGVRVALSQIGLTEIPACGSNADVLAYHGLDAAGIAKTVLATALLEVGSDP